MGRGLRTQPTPVKKIAIKYSNNILEAGNLDSELFLKKIKETSADLFIVVGYKYLKEKVYSHVRYGAINLHASLLPKYRGASPIQYAIMNGDKKTGLTTFYLNNKIDQGNIIHQIEYEIKKNILFEEVYSDLMALSKKILIKTLNMISSKKIMDVNKREKSSYAPKILKEDFVIDWNLSALNIHNKIRALSYRGAYGFYRKKE